MTTYRDPFMLGPLGKLRALPVPNGPEVGATYLRTIADQRSLTGSVTRDILGVRRAWEFFYTWKLDLEVGALLARYLAPPSAPLRLIDPVTVNLASLDASTGGGITRSPICLTATAGAVAYTVPSTMPADLDDKLDAALLWSLAAGQSGTILFDSLTETRPPALPSTPVSVAQWATGTTTVTPFIRPFDVSGVALTDVNGSPVALTGAWTRLTQLNVSLAGNAASFAYGLKVATTSGARTVTVSAPLVVHAASLPASWSVGGGAPRVVLMDMDGALYQWRAHRQVRLLIQEA